MAPERHAEPAIEVRCETDPVLDVIRLTAPAARATLGVQRVLHDRRRRRR